MEAYRPAADGTPLPPAEAHPFAVDTGILVGEIRVKPRSGSQSLRWSTENRTLHPMKLRSLERES